MLISDKLKIGIKSKTKWE